MLRDTRQPDSLNPESGKATTLPTSSAKPVSKNGGTCDRVTPKLARVPQSAMAPKARRLALTLESGVFEVI